MASAAILAGGQARRFGGRDKSALRVGGRRFSSVSSMRWRMSPTISCSSAAVRWKMSPDSGRCIAIVVPDSGPLGGLDAALTAARDDALLLIACDMPFVTAAFLENLLALSDAVDAVVPRTERGYHPLCAVYGRVPSVGRPARSLSGG